MRDFHFLPMLHLETRNARLRSVPFCRRFPGQERYEGRHYGDRFNRDLCNVGIYFFASLGRTSPATNFRSSAILK